MQKGGSTPGEDIMTRAERARKLFLQGYNCAQAIVCAFADLTGADEGFLARASIGLGGGMGRLRSVCGAVSGAAVLYGLLFPEEGKSEIYARIQRHANAFRERNGSFVCGELLTGAGVRYDASPNAQARTAEYYKKRPCAELVFDSADILERALQEAGRLD